MSADAVTKAVADSAARFKARAQTFAAAEYSSFDAVLQICGGGKTPLDSLFAAAMKKRADKKNKEGIIVTLPSGTAVCRCQCKSKDAFATLEILRKAFAALPKVKRIAVDIRAPDAATLAVYAALVYHAKLPGDSPPSPRITFGGVESAQAKEASIAAETNTLARVLTKLPPNILTPEAFAKYAESEARKAGMRAQVYSTAQLKQCGAGLFLATARASSSAPFLLKLSHTPRAANKNTAATLIGKGVTFDTGGVNVKPQRYMRGMGKDMAGAAAVFAAALSAAKNNVPMNVDAWLAIAENAIGADGYYPDQVITAANGKSVEIVHTDAEGRMLLADSLAIAAKENAKSKTPKRKLVTMATLTGSMHIALGERMSGFFAEDETDRDLTLQTAAQCGERLCWFSAPADYAEELKSNAADIKQCTEGGVADHIMAVLFLREFAEKGASWMHWDLSSASCDNGLAASPGPATGFGAASLFALLKRWAA